jgi:hypothetical protein
MSAKAGSANYNRFVEEHGETVYELEAVPAAQLQRILHDAIDTVLDVEAFNTEVAKERADANYLISVQRSVKRVLSKLEVPPEGTIGT